MSEITILRKFGISYCISNVAVILKKNWLDLPETSKCAPLNAMKKPAKMASGKMAGNKKEADDEGRTIIFLLTSQDFICCHSYAAHTPQKGKLLFCEVKLRS